MLLSQILPSRAKRGINEIGTLWKWIAGTPDHDDLITVQNKIDNLIQNNNNQFVINSKLFKEIKTLSENLQTVISNPSSLAHLRSDEFNGYNYISKNRCFQH